MRVSDLAWSQRLQGYMSDNSQRLQQLQTQVASGQKISQASDDPVAYAQQAQITSDLATAHAQQTDMTNEQNRLNSYDNVLGNLNDLVQAATTLTQQAGNATTDSGARAAMATQVNDMINQALQDLNSQLQGQYMFSGTRTGTAAFATQGPAEQITSVTYQGDLTYPSVRLPNGTMLNVSLNGQSVSQGGGSDLFGSLISLRDALQAGNTDYSANLGQLQQVSQNLLDRRGEVGQAARYVGAMSAQAQQSEAQLSSNLATVGSTDLAQAFTQLSATQLQQQALYEVIAQQSKLSLVDFLR